MQGGRQMQFDDVATSRTADARSQRERQFGNVGDVPRFGNKRARSPQNEAVRQWMDAKIPPPPLPLSGVMPGSVQKVIVSNNYPCAVDATQLPGRSRSDGVIWFPLYRGGTTIIRTLLASAASTSSVVTVTPALTSDIPANGFAPTNMTVTLITDVMLPAGPAINNAFTAIGNDVATYYGTGNFELGRTISGVLRVFSNSGNNANNIISGEIGGSQVGDSRGLLSFDRNAMAQRSNFSKNSLVATAVSNGVAFHFPPMPPPYGITSRFVSRHRGNLVSDIAFSGTQYMFVSHVGTCSTVPSPPTNFSIPTNVLPWGAQPSFTLNFMMSNYIGGARFPTVLRCVFLYAYYNTSGWSITSQMVSVPVTLGRNDNSVVDVEPLSYIPTNTYDIRIGIWVGTLFYLDIPVANVGLVSGNIITWFNDEDERELSNPFMARLDDVASGVSILNSGSLFVQCVDSGISTAAGNVVGSTPIDAEFGVTAQHDLLSMFLDDRTSDVTSITPAC